MNIFDYRHGAGIPAPATGYTPPGSGHGSLDDAWGGFQKYKGEREQYDIDRQRAQRGYDKQSKVYDKFLKRQEKYNTPYAGPEGWGEFQGRDAYNKMRERYENRYSTMSDPTWEFGKLNDSQRVWNLPTDPGDFSFGNAPEFSYQKNVENPLYQELKGYHHAYGLENAGRMAQSTKYDWKPGGANVAPKPYSATNY